MRKADEHDVDDQLKAMGFAPMPPEQVARRGGGQSGKFLRVCGKGGDEPIALSVSRDLRNATGLGGGTCVDVWYGMGKLALVVGRGSLKMVKYGGSVRLSCPLLLEKVHAKPNDVWPAEVKDGVIFCVIPGAAERAAAAAAETRRAQAKAG